MYEHADKAYKDIEKNGCHIIHDEDDDTRPSVTYSIGMKKSIQCPDVAITGMDKDTAHFLINEYLYRIRDGETFEADKTYDEFLEDALITFKVMDKGYYESVCPHALWFYDNDDFTMLHLIWPDIDGVWPWQKKASKEYRWLMPRLYQD